MERKQTVLLRALGVLSIVFGLFGLWYNGLAPFDLSWSTPDPEAPYFEKAFLTMSAFCIVCYVLLTLSGVELARLRRGWLIVFITVLVAELGYYGTISYLWRHPNRELSLSVAAATGVSSGGMTPQMITLFPLWGILLAMYIRRLSGSEAPNKAL